MTTAVAVGSVYHTGEKAPVSGRFEFVRHGNPDSHCEPKAEEQSIALAQGEALPPCRSCAARTVWSLAEIL
ncbi:hypothetical protein SAMN05444166_5190 [Singulisphaera sp. GP187]|uniref:hypothetical protein n=1 Tax=Singulisphaera sp. GP187 TaxID=1882752 RepID=UPI000927F8DE|nr:hypothetical protein [Singulisphaera sp. GP187]SIO56140.1 hypothetical protein SAMN05444166_5190 [Singulisphaera sp. GP187]